VVKKDYLNKQE